MYSVREILAIVLAAILGLALVLRPRAVLQLQWFMFDTTSGRRGKWGNPDQDQEFPGWIFWAARAVGVVVLGIGAVILALPHV